MNKRNKIRIVGAMCIVAIWLIVAICAWILPPKEMSESERRKLEQLPELTVENVLEGDFTQDFETYTLDQFPLRDRFRQVKSIFHYYVLGQKDNNDIYVYDGYAAKMEYPLNENSVTNAIGRFNDVYDAYLKDKDVSVYFSIIPDKGYYMAEESGHLKMDYETLFSHMRDISWAEYVDVTDLLTKESYYYTDTHWRQEKILPVAQRLCETMGADVPNDDEFVTTSVEKPFYGVYCGQAALPMSSEDMYYLQSDQTLQSMVTDYEMNQTVGIYDDKAVNDKDLYDTFLHGAKALLKIENPLATSEKELVVFRDSFGSSIIPLMLKGYKTITVIDLRYITSKFVGNYVEFDDQDVLFLYSTLVLNNSFTLK